MSSGRQPGSYPGSCRFKSYRPRQFAVEGQLADRCHGKAEVAGSNPVGRAICAGVAQRWASRLYRGLCGFESCRQRHRRSMLAEAEVDRRQIVDLLEAGASPVGQPRFWP